MHPSVSSRMHAMDHRRTFRPELLDDAVARLASDFHRHLTIAVAACVLALALG
jgi:hypothetical protein